MADTTDEYSLSKDTPVLSVAAPQLDYQPRDPKAYRPAIGLIGCGGITAHHLAAYRKAGYHVAALCDTDEARVRARQAAFFPDAKIETDYRRILADEKIEVVDIATHPAERAALIENALRARKHVLSQKPFVLDLDTGERLADLAVQQGVQLAVNQNGRWAPHFSYIRQAVKAGLLGTVTSVHCGVHWDHRWVVGTPFDDIYDLVLYDFAIHWFDFVSSLFGDRRAAQVFATRTAASEQQARPPLLAQALIQYEDAQASLVFDANVRYGPQDHTYVAGTKGSLASLGPHLGEQTVTLFTADGSSRPVLEGSWFDDGFHGTMAELLCAIEEGRTPSNNARDNLRGLALCFAAIASASQGTAQTPGQMRHLPTVLYF